MKRAKTAAFGLALIFIGCATSSQELSKLHTGMSRQEVEQTLGTPHSVSSDGTVTFLMYYLDRENMGGKGQYYVLLKNDRVQSFGEKGDFGTTVLPQERLQLELKRDK